ncbi:MAG: winged helix DNA-binding protein [Bernardetiaceae bacterium]|nr:winged helix DNA-binding protein [Bernardetiaceae bacterium]
MLNQENQDNQEKRKRSLDFAIKATWLSIAKMYNMVGTSHGITHSTGFVLLNIDPDKGSLATKIAPLMGMEARSLTRILKSMEENDLIFRKEEPADRRKVIICLTEEGRKRREAARQAVKTFNNQVKEQVSPQELENFFKVIAKINEVADKNLTEKNNYEAIVAEKLGITDLEAVRKHNSK